MVEIPESLGRDIDRGKRPEGGMPLEEVLHPTTVEQLHKQAAEPEPIRADKLQAISPAEAAARRTFDGEILPSMPRPRRVIPAPFQRSRVRGGQHGKKWQPVPASEVQMDDMHEGVGRGALKTAHGGKVRLEGKGGMVQVLDDSEMTRVFR